MFFLIGFLLVAAVVWMLRGDAVVPLFFLVLGLLVGSHQL